MSDSKKRYWKGIEEYKNDPEYVKYADKEFPEYLPVNGNSSGDGSSRRDFLKLMGFGVAAASLAACEAPVRKAIPYLNKPVDVDPGIPNYYASTYLQGGEYSSIVVKTREGRPIKIEGNNLSTISMGGTSSQVQASVLSLYDKERLRGPMKNGNDVSWEDLDKEVVEKLNAITSAGGQIRIVSNSILSPTTLKVIEDFKAKFSGTEHITYDAFSASGILKANEETFGVRAIPAYDFSKAKTVVSVGADFLGTWISPVEYSAQYSKMRKLNRNKRSMSRHYQFETNLSLTGANADYRSTIKPSEEGLVIAGLYNLIASKADESNVDSSATSVANLESAANELWNSRGSSLMVSGSNDPNVQMLVNGINSMLGNYGTTLDLSRPMQYRKGDDNAMNTFIDSVMSGSVGAVVFYNCNPVYNHGRGAELAGGLSTTELTVSTSDRMDETASLAGYVAPDHHFLESWNDAEPRQDYYSLGQPTISPLFNTRQGQESLLSWTGNGESYFNYLKEYWRNNMYMESEALGFQYFWDKSLQDGVYVKVSDTTEQSTIGSGYDPTSAARSVAANYGKGSGIELMLYQKVAIGDGSQANNPWLQETPDTITKSTWDNYITVSQADATEAGIINFEGKTSMANLTVGGTTVKVPIIIQPGQARGTIGLALGYGRKNAGKVGNNVGVDANPFIGSMNGHSYYAVTSGVSLEVLPEAYQVAQTQTHETYMGRVNVVQEATLEEYKKDPSAGRWNPRISTWINEEHQLAPGEVSLWKGHKYPNHHWGLIVDMNSCTGCSACHVACQAENNIPVVGREEVINRREMHWMRIDRYYGSDANIEDTFQELEIASENPEVTFQPMMCQHCNNASCETVCPVAATTHSTEGLNQMAYNRCIGTRYCANNCPYKVRRFNWFKYHDNDQFPENTAMNNDLGKMVLNPDVTVRSRGVMEKCSFCVQRIQAGKVTAKIEGRRTNDSDITTACASACPTDALVFGDMNDSESRISKILQIKDYEGDGTIEKKVGEERAYTMLEEVGTKPNVFYLTKIRNKDKAPA
jgi:molybdopterin-containing oxidoreductase family iron-sulfur binding subunit